jgi:ornithine cyclodeaminase/alanine dehydrogenase-like protein (mu-crystallin family)
VATFIARERTTIAAPVVTATRTTWSTDLWSSLMTETDAADWAGRSGLDADRVERVPTIGEMLAGIAPGRSGTEITVFDTAGLGLHDVAVAAEATAWDVAAGSETAVEL